MEEFMKSGSCMQLDWVGVHWYGGADFASFARSMSLLHEKYQRPLLVTEFAPADWNAATPEENRRSPEQVLAFMKKALPWMEAQDWIAGYAWFSFSASSAAGTSSALFNADGSLTALGRFYASVTTENPEGDQSIVVVPTPAPNP